MAIKQGLLESSSASALAAIGRSDRLIQDELRRRSAGSPLAICALVPLIDREDPAPRAQ